MHPVITMKHWSHHLHDGMLAAGHHIDQHLRSGRFWIGVGFTLLAAGLAALIVILAKNAPLMLPGEYLMGNPYLPYR